MTEKKLIRKEPPTPNEVREAIVSSGRTIAAAGRLLGKSRADMNRYVNAAPRAKGASARMHWTMFAYLKHVLGLEAIAFGDSAQVIDAESEK